MNSKKLLGKLAVLALGLAALHMEANTAKASSPTFFLPIEILQYSHKHWPLWYKGADCNVCHGSDGSTGPCGIPSDGESQAANWQQEAACLT